MRLLWHTIRWLPAICLLLAVSGCKTTDRAVEVRTEYRTATHRDSVHIDCTDTVYIVERGDTVRITEVKTLREIKYQLLRDTIMVTDTVKIEKVTGFNSSDNEGKIVKMKANRWKWFFAGFGVCFLIIFAAIIVKKIYFR